MKIAYVANIRMPTEKAHGIQIMKMCDAFAKNGAEIELVVPRSVAATSDPFEYYAMQASFPIRRIFSINLVRFGRIGFLVQSLIFALSSSWYTLWHKKDVVFGRDEIVLLFNSFHTRTVWETHVGSYTAITRLLLRTKVKIIAITEGLKKLYVSKGVDPKRIAVAPDAVDANLFDISLSKLDARQKVELPLDAKIVLYTGHLYDWKGARVLAQAAALLPQDSIKVAFVGGTDNDIASFKNRFGHIANVMILGKKPYALMPVYMKAADILTLPNSPVNDISSLYTSPMKLFEYMAVNRPIVASDLPSIREILSEKNAVLVPPDNPQALAKGITAIFADSPHAEVLAERAYNDSKRYTWLARAASILSFIKA